MLPVITEVIISIAFGTTPGEDNIMRTSLRALNLLGVLVLVFNPARADEQQAFPSFRPPWAEQAIELEVIRGWIEDSVHIPQSLPHDTVPCPPEIQSYSDEGPCSAVRIQTADTTFTVSVYETGGGWIYKVVLVDVVGKEGRASGVFEFLGELWIGADAHVYSASSTELYTDSGSIVRARKINFPLFRVDGELTVEQVEVDQPYFVIDGQCRLPAPLRLTSERCGQGQLIEELPEGAPLRVLFQDEDDDYCQAEPGSDESGHPVIAVTDFGLVGWTVIDYEEGWHKTDGCINVNAAG